MSDLAQSLSWGRDEADLVHELQAGSDAAFDYLVTYYHAGVFNLVYGILSDSSDAADVTQEVFLRAFSGIRGFRQGSSLKTWLYRISVRQALNHRPGAGGITGNRFQSTQRKMERASRSI
jgi:RNA polymerase sigma-70 factor (ECF subfamily)